MRTLLAFLSVTISHTFATSYEGCNFELTDTRGITAEYDLTYFHLAYDVFRVRDVQNAYFTYMFNICGSIEAQLMSDNQTIPSACAHPKSNHGPCTSPAALENSSIPCTSWETTTGKNPSAIQVDTIDNDTTSCYWLGMEVRSQDHMPQYKMELLRPNDAGKGVIFTILNGEWCADVGRNRELRIKLECPDDDRIEFEPSVHQTHINAETVLEIDTCIYELAVVSPNACPNKCVSRLNLEMFAVCGTNGICEADPYGNGDDKYPNGTLRCLCDDGYMGDICVDINSEITIIDQTHPGLLAAIIICIILLGIAIVCAAVLCHKIRMRELEETQSMDHLSGGMLQDAEDAQLAQVKTDAMSMNISSEIRQVRQPTSTAAVQLQTVDDQMETDKVDDRNELLDDNEDDTPDVAGTED